MLNFAISVTHLSIFAISTEVTPETLAPFLHQNFAWELYGITWLQFVMILSFDGLWK